MSHRLVTTFAERKLIFVVDVIRACVNIREEGERVAASKRRGPVPPYAGHVNLNPTSASTWDHVRAQSRAEAPAGPNDLLPPRAQSVPKPGAGGNSDTIYSTGGVYSGSAQFEDIEAFENGSGSAVRDVDGFRSAIAAGSGPGPAGPAAAVQFLSDAVALGQGAGASLVARRRQAMYEVAVAGW